MWPFVLPTIFEKVYFGTKSLLFLISAAVGVFLFPEDWKSEWIEIDKILLVGGVPLNELLVWIFHAR